jgi:hypothetical protein
VTDPELIAENARLRAIIERAAKVALEAHPGIDPGIAGKLSPEQTRAGLAFTFKIAATIRAILAEAHAPDLCEHGIPEGEYCGPCNRAYKEAAREHDAEIGGEDDA